MTEKTRITILDKAIMPVADGADCSITPPVHIDTEAVEANAKILSALADPTRLGIVTMLAGLDEPLCVCQIVTQFKLGQPTISHHLKLLREARLVTWEKRGLWVYYSLNREALGKITTYISRLQKAASAALAV